MLFFDFIAFSDIVGFVGVSLLIGAYASLTFNFSTPSDLSYPLMNFIASICLTYSLVFNFNLSSLLIEIFWGSISLFGIWKNHIKKKS